MVGNSILISKMTHPPMTKSDYQNILLNGCFRSGTTLLDKLLHTHQSIVMASQPYPVLFFYAKSLFLKEQNLTQRYPLGHLFMEASYSPEAFNDFLRTYKFNQCDIDTIFSQLKNVGTIVKTPEICQCEKSIQPGAFWDLYQQFNNYLQQLFPKPQVAKYVGAKEAFVEEYIPYLLSKENKVILIIRDPRDVIASASYSKSSYMGDNRPVLFSLRAWRKSVAYALAYESDPNCMWLKYEDLVTHPEDTLARITTFLQLDEYPADAFEKGINDQYGQLWKSNSSFGGSIGLDISALGRFTERLPKEVIAYIESICYPEMHALNYEFSMTKNFSKNTIETFQDTFEVNHEKFSKDQHYSSDPVRIAQECKRFELLQAEKPNLTDEESQQWFIASGAYSKLRKALR